MTTQWRADRRRTGAAATAGLHILVRLAFDTVAGSGWNGHGRLRPAKQENVT